MERAQPNERGNETNMGRSSLILVSVRLLSARSVKTTSVDRRYKRTRCFAICKDGHAFLPRIGYTIHHRIEEISEESLRREC